ncbi:MAG: TIGR03118 family protein [Gammaproteobacteria bacterium]|nr:TIGR03118 family protein [Gammaproteobacteria bacterium]
MSSRLPAFVLLVCGLTPGAAHAIDFSVRTLVRDDASVDPAPIVDPVLKNAWGAAYTPTGAFWVGNNATGTATIYAVDPATNAPSKVGLTVAIPGAGSVTGVARAGVSGSFNGDAFLFVGEDGTIAGWRGALGTQAEILQSPSDAVYKGAAVATVGTGTYLYAANFHDGRIDVVKGESGAADLAGGFTDPTLPAGYAPFNVAKLGESLYVTYAARNAAGDDELTGPGLGLVDEFRPDGTLVKRVATGGALNAPWGLAIAPATFGAFAGSLLVGNFGDGSIAAFDPLSGVLLGQLTTSGGRALAIDGLWALLVGNDGTGGSSGALYFTAGPGGETHGRFGVVAPVPLPASLPMLLAGASTLARVRRRRG